VPELRFGTVNACDKCAVRVAQGRNPRPRTICRSSGP
jgi:hypothetical protein